MSEIKCAECKRRFTPQEWEARHGYEGLLEDGEVHEECCRVCKQESA